MTVRKKTAKPKKGKVKKHTRKERDIIKTNTIKSYTKDVLRMKISKTATDNIRVRFNELLKLSLKKSKELAKDQGRNTIMPRDINPAIDKIVSRKNLSWPDIMKEIRKLSAIDLGSLATGIDKYIQEQKNKGRS